MPGRPSWVRIRAFLAELKPIDGSVSRAAHRIGYAIIIFFACLLGMLILLALMGVVGIAGLVVAFPLSAWIAFQTGRSVADSVPPPDE